MTFQRRLCHERLVSGPPILRLLICHFQQYIARLIVLIPSQQRPTANQAHSALANLPNQTRATSCTGIYRVPHIQVAPFAGVSGRFTRPPACSGSRISLRWALPESVQIAMADLAETATGGLLALAVGTGLQVMSVLMDEEVTAVAGPKGKWNPERTAVRHGSDDGQVTLGGRRVAIRRLRVRAIDGSGERPLASYELFSQTEILGRLAMERMLAKLSCRRYGAGLEPVGQAVEATARSTSKSAISRRFVAATETVLAELMGADLSGLDLVALMVDGVHFGAYTCVVALGIGIDGTKHPLGVVEGSTENATVVTELLVGLRDRGLDVCRPILVVIDGAKALATAVTAVFDRPVIARCQLHKIRNVQNHLPDHLASTVGKKMRAADHDPSALAAEATLEALARDLERTHPGAAARGHRATGRLMSVIATSPGQTVRPLWLARRVFRCLTASPAGGPAAPTRSRSARGRKRPGGSVRRPAGVRDRRVVVLLGGAPFGRVLQDHLDCPFVAGRQVVVDEGQGPHPDT